MFWGHGAQKPYECIWLLDLMLKTGMQVSKKTKVDLHLHSFSLVEGAEKGLGQEIDLVLSHKYGGASLQGGALLFVPGDAMKAMRGGSDISFKGYLQTLASF